VPGTPFVDELVRRLRLDGGPVEVRHGGRQTADVVLHPAALDHPVTLRTSEGELAVAVPRLGADCRDAFWPGSTIDEAGFNVLLVHVDEVVATRDTTEPLRITAGGLQWPR